jgi:hypothetical protein
MTEKVKLLIKVINAADLTITELGELANQVDTFFWDKVGKEQKEQMNHSK